MDKIIDYFDKLFIDDAFICKAFSNVLVEKIVYFKEQKKVYFYLISKSIIDNEKLKVCEDLFKQKLGYFSEIKFKITYTVKNSL